MIILFQLRNRCFLKFYDVSLKASITYENAKQILAWYNVLLCWYGKRNYSAGV